MYRLTIPLFSIPLSSITPMWKPPSKAGPIGEVCTENLHKLWLSRQADREPIKRKRDKEQALAVCMLVLHYLPHLQFAPDELRMFLNPSLRQQPKRSRLQTCPRGMIHSPNLSIRGIS